MIISTILLAILAGGNTYEAEWSLSNFPNEENGSGGGLVLDATNEPPFLFTLSLNTEIQQGIENLAACEVEAQLGVNEDWIGPTFGILWDSNENGIPEEGLDTWIYNIRHEGIAVAPFALDSYDGESDYDGRSGFLSAWQREGNFDIVVLPRLLRKRLAEGVPQQLWFRSGVHFDSNTEGFCQQETADAIRCNFSLRVAF
jgi:hypothetical protein